MRGKYEYSELKKNIISLAGKFHPKFIIIEDKASGQSIIQDLLIETTLHIKKYKSTLDKVTRAVWHWCRSCFSPRIIRWSISWKGCALVGTISSPNRSIRAIWCSSTITRVERGRRVRELVHRDGLTGLLNHSALIAELEHASAYAVRHQEPLCFMMIDLDHFKRINDSFGHLVGDQVLAHVAQFFGSRFARPMPWVVMVAKSLAWCCGIAGGRMPAHSPPDCGTRSPTLRFLSAPDKEMVLRASIGVASLPISGTTARQLTAAADRAMYEAKTSGRNRVVMA